MKLRTFFIWVVVLFALVVIWQTYVPRALPDFEAMLFQVDTAALTSVHWLNAEGEFTLVRESDQWLITHHTRTVEAVPRTVQNLLAPLQNVSTQDPVTTKKTDWERYGVDEAGAIRVQLYDDAALLEDLWLSPLTEKDSLGVPKTYVRLAGESEVFQVPAELSRAFQMPFFQFRNGTFLAIDSTVEIVALSYFFRPDSSLNLTQAAHWQNDTLPPTLDSTAVKTFLTHLKSIASNSFADDFDETRSDLFFHRALEMQTEGEHPNIRLECFRDTTWRKPFVLHSSQNPGTYFASDSAGLYQEFFGFFEKRRFEATE